MLERTDKTFWWGERERERQPLASPFLSIQSSLFFFTLLKYAAITMMMRMTMTMLLMRMRNSMISLRTLALANGHTWNVIRVQPNASEKKCCANWRAFALFPGIFPTSTFLLCLLPLLLLASPFAVDGALNLTENTHTLTHIMASWR